MGDLAGFLIKASRPLQQVGDGLCISIVAGESEEIHGGPATSDFAVTGYFSLAATARTQGEQEHRH